MNTNDESRERNKRVVQHFLEVFSTGNVPAVLDCLEDNCVWWISGNLPGISGSHDKTAMGQLLAGVVDVYKQGALPVTPLAWTIENNRVAVEAESYAELKNGKVFNNSYHFLFELNGNRITRVKEYSDTLHMYQTFITD